MKTTTISIFTAALAFALTGCQKESAANEQTQANAISFVNLNDRVLPRGANDISADFGVYAVYNSNGKYGNGWMMDNVTVDGKDFHYSPTKFWPTEGVVDFYSYAPASSANLNLSGVNYGTGADATFLGAYTVAIDAQEDFTVAKPVLGVNYKGQSKNIELLFGHALSQVKFNVTMDGATIDAANYTMVVNNVILDVPFNRNDISLATQAWGTTLSRSPEYRIYSGATNTGHYNILPQTLSAGNSATITVDVTLTDNVTGETYINGYLKPFVLDGTLAGFAQFEQGKSYTFAVQIGVTSEDVSGTPVFDPISFDAQLSPWVETPITVS